MTIHPVPKPKSPKKRERRPIARKSAPKRRKPVKRVNAKRRTSEFARAYGGKDRVAFVKAMACLVGPSGCSDVIDNAHITTGGMGRKADAKWIVPLCRAHHRELHATGIQVFELHHRRDLVVESVRVNAAWLATQGTV